MGAPAGLRDGILPCVPKSLGLLDAFTWNLFLSLPAALHMSIPQAPACFVFQPNAKAGVAFLFLYGLFKTTT
ncbi:hypothetical protein Pyn_28236 [Prunus yedoensis var. nudiflora]|uniref:Uncharacterized protein n=1 Tax=Prunus yedoensis var. nudiflora TaxID=2094558 RepID=A0A314YT94_PRUYE|nr:hypothetical protein Pyn_28236 [Prunus yedoensis var. nudiflora]